MPTCFALACSNTSGRLSTEKSFYKIPDPTKEKERCERWLHNIANPKWNLSNFAATPNRVVCSDHFHPDCIKRDLRFELMATISRERRELRPGAIPTIFKHKIYDVINMDGTKVNVDDFVKMDTAKVNSEDMEEVSEEEFMDAISDISTDSIQESPNSKVNHNAPLIQFSKHPKNIREYAAKVRKIERKIMLGLLLESEEAKLRKSKYFTGRFEKLLNLSRNMQKTNLYKVVCDIYLNETMMTDMQKKCELTSYSANIRRKLQSKLNSLKSREKAVQEKITNGVLSQNDVNNILRDMYFIVKFNDGTTLDHNSIYQPEHIGANEAGPEVMVCDYCQSSMEKNRFGQREELLICKDCGNKAHPSCLSYSVELVEQIRADDSWQCIDCKACVICNGTGDPDTLLFCDACDKGYHMQCHSPKLEQMPSGKWACSSCIAKGKSVGTQPGVMQQPVFIIDDEEPKKVIPEIQKPSNDQPAVSPASLMSAPKTDSIVKMKSSPLKPPVMSVPQAGILYPPPPAVAFSALPVGSTSVAITQSATAVHGHPVPIPIHVNQPHLIPVNYAVVPNGGHTQPMTLSQTVLGKGVQNDLNHILNPKTPLPDVRSSIREDVLRTLPPDVADWTVQDVCYYFKAHGYLQESKLLEEQEIDGRAMLLMSRNDCLTGLRIKLGPALKIYHMHIFKLQKRTDFLG